MTDLSLVKTRIHAGIWEGVLSGEVPGIPKIQVFHLDRQIRSVDVSPDPAPGTTWTVKIAIPPDLLSDGVQTFVIQTESGDKLASFSVVTGEPLDDDLRAEIDLIRAELDILKRAFRRHCQETL